MAERALHQAGVERDDVDFVAFHQPTIWAREVTQQATALTKARYLDTFQAFGSVAGANLPLSMALAEREGLLHPGDLVVAYAGMAGMAVSCAVLRWGR
jgi:3-oxoacyl-[acyl-carrier-protein] synthase-3